MLAPGRLPTSPDSLAAPALAPAVVRARGRPRKTLDERDDGNRRQALIQTAGHLFRQHGFEATSMRDIASAVGMGSGSPFYYFKTKGDLLAEVMRCGMADACQRQQLALDTYAHQNWVASPLKVAPFSSGLLQNKEQTIVYSSGHLLVLIKNHFQILLGKGSDFIPVMLYEWRSLNAAQRQQVARIKDAYEAVWVPVLQVLQAAGQLRGDVKLARLLIFGALNWAVQWYDPKKGLTLDELAVQTVALFIQDQPANATVNANANANATVNATAKAAATLPVTPTASHG
jgi:TetR/AcrR family transcriptional regulator, cholesterol catabolism regulator